MSASTEKFLIGIDEAGRGPLAGPVVVAGIKIATRNKRPAWPAGRQATRIFAGIRDSKKLTPKKREEWYKFLTGHPKIEWAVARIWPKTIDRINIARAANLGVLRVYKKLSNVASRQSSKNKYFTVRARRERTLLDGSLYLPAHIPHETIVRGDEKIPVIAAASIIAKVTRDRIMRRLHKKYPEYHFDIHKGYATLMHRTTLARHGYSVVHRRSFQVAKV